MGNDGEGLVRLPVMVRAGQREALRRVAYERGMSMSAVVRRVLARAGENFEKAFEKPEQQGE